MGRHCPREIFQEAHNGLNLFLNEYPFMDEAQRAKIAELVERFSRPYNKQGTERRPGMLCKVAPDGVLLIAPRFVKHVEAAIIDP